MLRIINWNGIVWRYLCLLSLPFTLSPIVSAQKALYIIDKEEQPHLITDSNSDAFMYGYNKQYKSKIESSRIALADYPHY